MSSEATKAIEEADWAVLGPKLLHFADRVIARYRWRGLRVETSPNNKLTVEGRSAEDFIQVALKKLHDGKRKYLPGKTLEENLRFVVESLIANFHKNSSHLPTRDRTIWEALAEEEDPIETIEDPSQANAPAELLELRERQKSMLADFEKQIEHDEELALVLMAYRDEKYKTAEIAEATNIAASRISELKRKLAQRADKFLKEYPQYSDLIPLQEVL